MLLGRLGPGDWFGEMALLNETTRGATVRCVEAMDALSLPKSDFTVLAANLPELRQSFERVMEAAVRPPRRDDACRRTLTLRRHRPLNPGATFDPRKSGCRCPVERW